MKRLVFSLVAPVAVVSLVIVGCAQIAPLPTPTKAPAVPTKAAEPTKSLAVPTAAVVPTKAATEPTAVPAKKVDFPQKGRYINLIVPAAAGGTTDVGARLLAVPLEKELGVPVQVVNRPGATGQVGLTELAKSRPDGYTLAGTNLPAFTTPYLDPERQSTFERKDLQPVANMVSDAGVIAVKADSPFKTVKDLLDAAKANPWKIKTATGGILSTNHTQTLELNKLAGVDIGVVHFTGDGPGMASLLGGHVEIFLAQVGSVLVQVRSGEVRVLGVMDREESKFLPGVRTLEAQGYKLYADSSRGISAPAGTPREIVDLLSSAIKRAMDDQEHKKKMDEAGLALRYMDARQYEAYWADYEARIRPLLLEFRKQKQ